MASNKRTWIWVIVGVLGVGVLAIVALVGVGFYFVSQRVDTKHSTPTEALTSLDQVVQSFGERRALYTIDANERPHLTAPLESLPTSDRKASDLWIHAWDPNSGRLVRVSLPLWMLRFGDQKIRVAQDEGGLKFEEFEFDMAELERIGPSLIVDHRGEDGERILLWTK
jgi:hypothetical protein